MELVKQFLSMPLNNVYLFELFAKKITQLLSKDHFQHIHNFIDSPTKPKACLCATQCVRVK